MAKQSSKRNSIKPKKKKAPPLKSCAKTCGKNKSKSCEVSQPTIPVDQTSSRVGLLSRVVNKLKNLFRLGS